MMRTVLVLSTLFVLCLFAVQADTSGPHSHVLPRWGTYRPNIYFGLKARVPASPLLGMMWHDAYPLMPGPGKHSTSGIEIRHDAAEHDKMKRFGWLRHNGRDFGVHEVLDKRLQLNLTTVYRHVRTSETGRETVVAHIKGEPLSESSGGKPERRRAISFVWYLALPSDEDSVSVLSDTSNEGCTDDVRLHVSSRDPVGSFTVSARPSKGTHMRYFEPSAQKPQFLGLRRASDAVWNTKEAYENAARGSIRNQMEKIRQEAVQEAETLSSDQERERVKARMQQRWAHVPPRLVNAKHKKSNVMMFQYMAALPFELELTLQEIDANHDPAVGEEDVQIQDLVRQAEADFDKRFEDTFQLSKRGYSEAKIQFGQAALSNLLGGIGHFHGKAIVQLPEDPAPRETAEEHELLSGCPSRSFFPRGFMWDEGFHQLLVSCWDTELSSRVLKSWADQVDGSGWLPREQILGAEARSRVPEKFQAQRPSVANPPTLLLAIDSLMERAKLQPDVLSTDEVRSFLHAVFPPFLRQARWYLSTQASATPGKFRWADRTPDHCLSSGLDDYPRGEHVLPQEAHVDLHSWLIMVCRTVARMAQWLADHHTDQSPLTTSELGQIVTELETQANTLHSSLDDFWSQSSNSYQDLRYNNVTGELVPVEHDGYVSLFPFLLGLVPGDSPRMTHILKQMSDPGGLFSKWGLRSLSPRDRFFQSQEQYWRGPIWINLNYLAVRALHTYATAKDGYHSGPHAADAKKLYKALRKGLINNIFKNYDRSGYLWEQYSAKNGKGQRSHPFTGWTALVLLMMSERY